MTATSSPVTRTSPPLTQSRTGRFRERLRASAFRARADVVPAHAPDDPRSVRLRRRATASGLALGSLAYFLSLTDYSNDLGRKGNPFGFASDFFDIQGRALMDGHLAVPPGASGSRASYSGTRSTPTSVRGLHYCGCPSW